MGKACIESRRGFIVFTQAEQGRAGMKSLTRGPACHPAMILVVLSIVTSVVEYTGKKMVRGRVRCSERPLDPLHILPAAQASHGHVDLVTF